VLELDADAEAADLLLDLRLRRLLVEVAVAIALAFGLGTLFARYVNRHLRALTRAALRVADGDLRDEVVPRTRDELAQLGGAFNRMLAGLRDRELIRETFGRFVTEEVAARILADPSRVRLGGEQRQVTILMSDLRGFTALSEQLGPEATVDLLNRYLSCMCEVILKHRGTIGEFIGDGILVLFGAPESGEDDAHRALACAIEMQLALERFNETEGQALDMGIGIDSGTVIAGNVGSDKRMKYGVVGDAVNLAARIESATVGSQVLLSEATRSLVGDAAVVGPEFELRAKGRREPLRCCPLLGLGKPYDLTMPRGVNEGEICAGLSARCFPVRDKQVALVGHDASVTHVSASGLRLITDWHAESRDDCKLSLTLDDGSLLDHLYGKVSAVLPLEQEGEGCRLQLQIRLSPLLPEARGAYDAALARLAARTSQPGPAPARKMP
jgi:class 3 adenylate cyclase